MTSTAEVRYTDSLMERLQTSTLPTSDTAATTTVVDGFTMEQTDHIGGSWSYTRQYLSTGILSTITDPRGNTSSTQSDLAGRPIIQTDAAGHETSITYSSCCDQPASITDALGQTVNYAYKAPDGCKGDWTESRSELCPQGESPTGWGRVNIRSRKIAEYGTGIQPATYAYDSADRMTTLRTFRVDDSTITTDPTGRTDGDTTTWTYHDATGLQLSKTFADGTQETRSYNALNQLATITNARGLTQTFAYNSQTAELASQNFASSPERNYSYNHLGQLLSVSDESGSQQLSYNNYSDLLTESTSIANQSYSRTEQYDNLGRNIGYQLQRDGSTIHQNRYAYDNRGRIATAGFYHANTWEDFTYSYLQDTSILSTLEHPNGITSTRSYEPNRNLLTSIVDSKNGTTLSNKAYSYDAIGRPTARTMNERSDTFAYNAKSELTAAQLGSDSYDYAYDNIGNRKTAQEIAEEITYATNSTNEYTAIDDFIPEFDSDGNQTRLQTSTGIWAVEYNAENRPVKFTSTDGNTIAEARYDYMGRRAWKKVTVNGNVNLYEAYIYRGYLQIAAIDLRGVNAGHFITWDPTQPTATRPLAIEQKGTWYFCPARPAAQANPSGVPSGLGVDCSSSINGLDLSKNVTELYDASGAIATSYQYSPFGAVEASGNESTLNPIQWSSEIADEELGLAYYNYRHYNPADGRWIYRDPIAEEGGSNLYGFVRNMVWMYDVTFKKDVATCAITMQFDIVIYPYEKNKPNQAKMLEIAMNIKKGIESEWSNHKKGCCTVMAQVFMQVEESGPWPMVKWFDDVNYIAIKEDVEGAARHRSFVYGVGGDTGVWGSKACLWTFAHEAGHLAGLPDYYIDNEDGTSEPKANYEGNMMAEFNGTVAQSEIDLILEDVDCPCGDSK